MGKRDTKAAKAKRSERRGKGSLKTDAKTAKSEAKADKRELNKKDEDDLDALLAEFRAMQSECKAVREEAAPPPSPRANVSLTAHPSRDEQK